MRAGQSTSRRSTTKGFKRTASLVTRDVRKVAESRGFAAARLLTHWDEIAGDRIAAIARPVDVSYGRGGMGATLTVLTTGPQAPMLEMEKDRLRDRVNAVYGYNAISRIRITQTAATGAVSGIVVAIKNLGVEGITANIEPFFFFLCICRAR